MLIHWRVRIHTKHANKLQQLYYIPQAVTVNFTLQQRNVIVQMDEFQVNSDLTIL